LSFSQITQTGTRECLRKIPRNYDRKPPIRRKVYASACYDFIKSKKIHEILADFAARLPLKFYEIYRTIAVLAPCNLSHRAQAAKFHKI